MPCLLRLLGLNITALILSFLVFKRKALVLSLTVCKYPICANQQSWINLNNYKFVIKSFSPKLIVFSKVEKVLLKKLSYTSLPGPGIASPL